MMRPPFRIPDGGVLLQGATGRTGRKHLAMMRAYGTPIVAGVSPNSDVDVIDGVPVFKNCVEAVRATGAVASIIMVPPLQLLEAIEDAVGAGVELIVSVTEGMPVSDAVRALNLTAEGGVNWVGASTPGIAIPKRLKLGFLPNISLSPGVIGFASKSGTLSYEIGYRLVERGLGQSVWVGVGGDPVKGTRFADLVPFFAGHDDTRALAIIGEIGGSEEEELADVLQANEFDKPVYAIIAGKSAKEGVTMGHAGAMVDGATGTIESKTKALERAGARVFSNISAMIEAMSDDLANHERSEEHNVFAADG